MFARSWANRHVSRTFQPAKQLSPAPNTSKQITPVLLRRSPQAGWQRSVFPQPLSVVCQVLAFVRLVPLLVAIAQDGGALPPASPRQPWPPSRSLRVVPLQDNVVHKASPQLLPAYEQHRPFFFVSRHDMLTACLIILTSKGQPCVYASSRASACGQKRDTSLTLRMETPKARIRVLHQDKRVLTSVWNPCHFLCQRKGA